MPDLRPTQPARSADARAVELVTRTLAEPRLVDVVVPRTQVPAKMRLVSRAERFEATADARRALQEAGFPVDASAATALGAMEEWNYELGVRVIAIAVRDAADPEKALGSVEDWRACDDDQLDALWARYQDLEAEMDPLGAGRGVSEADIAAIAAAAKRGDIGQLMSYGSQKLAHFATTSVAQPASSATPPS